MKNILETQHEQFKLRPQKCFKVGGGYYMNAQSEVSAYRTDATLSQYDAYLLLGQVTGTDLLSQMELDREESEIDSQPI